MGSKLLWLGLTILSVSDVVSFTAAKMVGAIIMIIGCVLLFLDK
jgi:hypothetical protein